MSDLGVIGVGVMGRNLALNAVAKGVSVSVFDQSPEAVQRCLSEVSDSGLLDGHSSLEDLVKNLAKPRKILLMVKAGETVDSVLSQIVSGLDEGDVIMDGGNSYFEDTQRREKEMSGKGIHYLGVGISGGEEGARKGPSMMVGGSAEGWETVKEVLQSMAARSEDFPDEPCAERVGEGGSGHYVKMIHNGIEYADMQLISETYTLLHGLVGQGYAKMVEQFSSWNSGRLGSYLIQITAEILRMADARTSKPVLEVIHDGAGQKGTGRWMSQQAFELGVPSTLVTEAVFARVISSASTLRESGKLLTSEPKELSDEMESNVRISPEDLEKALYISKVCSYAQGFYQLQEASTVNQWNLDLSKVAKLWRAGCIIRSRFLDKIASEYEKNPSLVSLLFAPSFLEPVREGRVALRRVVKEAVGEALPVPALSAALTFLDSIVLRRLPTNMVQAQRDYFGAHGFRRTDADGTFHLSSLLS